MIQSAHELQHELSRLADEDVAIGRELNTVNREIAQTELRLDDARRRKAVQEAAQ